MTAIAVNRVHNFSAGPAILPVEVLEEARENMLSLGNTGIGVMEHSHRGKAIIEVLQQTEKDCREILGLGPDWGVLYLTGGASQQFFQIPQNYLTPNDTANYVETGHWSERAIKEAKAFGKVHVAATSKDRNHTYIPSTFNYAPGAKYTHFTSNNTIFGTEWSGEPAPGDAPLICDASSNFMSRPVDVSKYTMIYAGAQKNLGPAGVTLVLMKKDFIEKGAKNIPTLLQYKVQLDNESCYNTPPVFAIYIMGLVFKWIKKQGGLAGVETNNIAKAKILYDCLDSSEFWRPPVAKAARSRMNVVWRLGSEELEEKLIKEAKKAGFDGLKGHRSVGGLRASIYNAMPKESIAELAKFMKEFERQNG